MPLPRPLRYFPQRASFLNRPEQLFTSNFPCSHRQIFRDLAKRKQNPSWQGPQCRRVYSPVPDSSTPHPPQPLRQGTRYLVSFLRLPIFSSPKLRRSAPALTNPDKHSPPSGPSSRATQTLVVTPATPPRRKLPRSHRIPGSVLINPPYSYYPARRRPTLAPGIEKRLLFLAMAGARFLVIPAGSMAGLETPVGRASSIEMLKY